MNRPMLFLSLVLFASSNGVLLVTPEQAGGQEGAQNSLTDEQLIQGEWECIAVLKDGKQVENFLGVRATMKGDRLTWIFPQNDGSKTILESRFRLDAGQNPKFFDWHPENKPTEVHKRYYVLAGDTLIWAANLGTDQRPESLRAAQWMFVMKRVADGK